MLGSDSNMDTPFKKFKRKLDYFGGYVTPPPLLEADFEDTLRFRNHEQPLRTMEATNQHEEKQPRRMSE